MNLAFLLFYALSQVILLAMIYVSVQTLIVIEVQHIWWTKRLAMYKNAEPFWVQLHIPPFSNPLADQGRGAC